METLAQLKNKLKMGYKCCLVNLIKRTDSMVAIFIENTNADIGNVMKLTVEAKGNAVSSFYLDRTNQK